MREWHTFLFSDSRIVQKNVTQIIYLGPLPNDELLVRRSEALRNLMPTVDRSGGSRSRLAAARAFIRQVSCFADRSPGGYLTGIFPKIYRIFSTVT